MSLFGEFMQFMNEQKVFSLALAFIVGVATAALVQALVRDLITPLYAPYTNFLNPQTAVTIGQSNFLVGDFIMQVVNWAVIMLVVFVIGKKLLKTS